MLAGLGYGLENDPQMSERITRGIHKIASRLLWESWIDLPDLTARVVRLTNPASLYVRRLDPQTYKVPDEPVNADLLHDLLSQCALPTFRLSPPYYGSSPRSSELNKPLYDLSDGISIPTGDSAIGHIVATAIVDDSAMLTVFTSRL